MIVGSKPNRRRRNSKKKGGDHTYIDRVFWLPVGLSLLAGAVIPVKEKEASTAKITKE